MAASRLRERRLDEFFGLLGLGRAFETWCDVCLLPAATLNSSSDWAQYIGPAARDQLEQAMCLLPTPLARNLARRVDRLDALFLAKARQDPLQISEAPWWWRDGYLS